jgi:hypothetical protein
LRAGSGRAGSVHGSVTGSDGSVTGNEGSVIGSVGSVHGSVGVVGGTELGVAVAEKVLPGPGNKVLSSVVRAPHAVKSGIVKVPVNFESVPALVMPCKIMVIGAVKQDVPTILTGGTVVGRDGSVTGSDGSVVGRDGSVTGSDGSVVGRDGRVGAATFANRLDDAWFACDALDVEAVTMCKRNLAVAVSFEFDRFM